MSLTTLTYLEDFILLSAPASVLEVVTGDGGREIVILDRTIFYPQGGGQPYDQGTIEGPTGVFAVEEVRFVDGIVKHIGHTVRGPLHAGDAVSCTVDRTRRELHSRIHSAGHVVDMAVHALHLPWVPGKGYHFPEGPYVEYAGSLDGLDREKLKADLERSCNTFVAENRETTLRFMEKERMKDVCHFVPDYIPEGKPARVVMYGDFGVPCGGTHVSHLGDIRHLTIRKIKPEGPRIRVGYDVER
ncbi:MAG: alanine--tRNA ligase-related protein [bacterium]|nr:alanine--tRNA ligase-related protein [bacterium]